MDLWKSFSLILAYMHARVRACLAISNCTNICRYTVCKHLWKSIKRIDLSARRSTLEYMKRNMLVINFFCGSLTLRWMLMEQHWGNLTERRGTGKQNIRLTRAVHAARAKSRRKRSWVNHFAKYINYKHTQRDKAVSFSLNVWKCLRNSNVNCYKRVS